MVGNFQQPHCSSYHWIRLCDVPQFTCSLIFIYLFRLITGSQLSKDVTSCNVTDNGKISSSKSVDTQKSNAQKHRRLIYIFYSTSPLENSKWIHNPKLNVSAFTLRILFDGLSGIWWGSATEIFTTRINCLFLES